MRTELARRRWMTRLAMCVLLALALPMLVVLQNGVAAAVPPTNDSIENATVVGSLPYTTTQNWSEATADPSSDWILIRKRRANERFVDDRDKRRLAAIAVVEVAPPGGSEYAAP